MQKHTKIYMQYFGYHLSDWMPCEICGCEAVDLHHIEARGMGGSNERDVIEKMHKIAAKHDKVVTLIYLLQLNYELEL